MPSSETAVRREPAQAALAGLMLFLAACTTAPTPTPTGSPPSAGDRCGADEVAGGGIDGTVVDPDGNPLNDIYVSIETGDGFRGTTRTAADGAFSAPGVSGEFTITTIDVDYLSVTRRVTVPCGEMVDVELVLTPVGE
jgi:hypothetical protein